MAYWLFWIKVTQETADSREALRPSSLSPWHQEIKLPLKGVLPVPAGRKMSLSSETGIEGQEACINKSCYFFSNLPSKPKLCLNSLLITHPHLISLFFRVLSTFLYLHLKSIGHMNPLWMIVTKKKVEGILWLQSGKGLKEFSKQQ